MRSGGRVFVIGALAALFARDSIREAGPLAAPLAGAPVSLPAERARSPLGLRFEANAGQSDPSVRFIARYGRATVLLTSDAMILLPPAAPPGSRRAGLHEHPGPDARVARGTERARSPATIRFRGASTAASMVGEAPIAAAITDFHGAGAAGRAISSFARVRVREAYPGIDVVFHAGPRGIELDFEVAPGADPSVISLASDREDDAPAARADGSLAFGGLERAILLSPPRTYEVGAGGATLVASAWSATSDARFTLGTRSAALPLVIDPVLDMATYLGASGDDVTSVGGVALDAAGNIYVSGSTTSPDLPVTSGAPDTTRGGADDVFVAKLSPDGKSLLYCTYLGGSGLETGNYLQRPVAVDPTGAAYVAGLTASNDFPTTAGAFDQTANGLYDAFVTKLAPDGKSLVYSTYLGGSSNDQAFGMAVDATGAVFVGGYTVSVDFPTTPGSITATSTGFVTKLAPGGGSLVYSTLVGSMSTAVFDVAARNGFAYVVGETPGAFPVTPGAYQQTYAGGADDAFVMQLAADGKTYVYSTYLGGDLVDWATAVDVDAAGNVLVAGNTRSTNFPVTANAFIPTPGADLDGFVAKVDAKGAVLQYGSYISGSSVDTVNAVCFDPLGNAFVAGITSGGLPTKASCAPNGFGFVEMIEPSGNVRFNTLLSEQVFGLACGAPGRVVGYMAVAGETGLATPGVFDPTFNAANDLLVFGLRTGPAGAGCAPCDGPFAATSPNACPEAARPLCNTSGALVGSCTSCTAVDLTRCTPGQVCSAVTGDCATCDGDRGTAAAAPCPTEASPFCDKAASSCRRCTSDADCASGALHAGTRCSLPTGACIPDDAGADGGNGPGDAAADGSDVGPSDGAPPGRDDGGGGTDESCSCSTVGSRHGGAADLLGYASLAVALAIAALRRRSSATRPLAGRSAL